jgi:aryl-alcohol dehydrogenase (NADP+)
MAAVALAWLDAQPAVTSTILGARTVEQLQQNLAAADLVLEPDALARLTEASTPRTEVYPYGPQAVQQRHRALTPER